MTDVEIPRNSRSATLTVAEVTDETADAKSVAFDVPAEAAERFAYAAGQFITLRIPSERTGSVARCYSLSSSPLTGERLTVTVKRTAGGYGSNWVCDNLAPGDAVECLPPSGRFTPDNLDEDLVLFGAGSGVTPMMSILKSTLRHGVGSVALFYANRDEDSVIFADELRSLTSEFAERLTVVHWLDTDVGPPTAQDIITFAEPFRERRAFLCGPAPFMDVVHRALSTGGVPRERVHSEVFVSLAGDPFADVEIAAVSETDAAGAATVEVELDGQVHVLSWPRSRTLVDIMLAAEIDVPYSCREGECGSCACTVLDGEVSMDSSDILDPEDIDNGYVLGCQAHPVSDRIRIEF